MPMFEDLRQDLRYATRTLSRERVFAAAAVLMLALGIGANSAMFALVDAILLRPLPFPTPTGWSCREQTPASPRTRVSPINHLDWKARSHTFESMAAYCPTSPAWCCPVRTERRNGSARVGQLRHLRRPRRAPRRRSQIPSIRRRGARVRGGAGGQSGDRGSMRTEHRRPQPAVDGIRGRWSDRAGRGAGDLSIEHVGLSTTRFPPAAPPNAGRAANAGAIGRLKPGVTHEAAAGDLSAIAAALARELPASNTGRGVTIEPLHGAVIGRELRLTSILFLGVVGLVLLICCANIANLLLARATVRRRELATRAALGAGRSRVVRQLLTESLVLGVVGGLIGVALGVAILRVAPSVIPPDLLPAPVTLSFDLRVLAFCALAT